MVKHLVPGNRLVERPEIQCELRNNDIVDGDDDHDDNIIMEVSSTKQFNDRFEFTCKCMVLICFWPFLSTWQSTFVDE